tara:strand:+ start:2159 stop:4522 length:2364 start_codon:yes stop_codon:yes gene_type:complete
MLLWYVVTIVALFLLFFTRSEAAINPQITFYGTLQDSGGNDLTGTYDMVFNFYAAASGGAALDTSTHTVGNGNPVSVVNGEFVVLLGSGIGNALDGVDFDSASIYVGLSVEGDPEMTPRERFTAAPYAFNSDTVDGYEANDFLRYNSTNTISATDTSTLFTIAQSGTGDIFNVFDDGTEVFSILDGGNVGVGTTTPGYNLTVAGDFMVTGALYDNNYSAGTNGMVLQSTGSGFQWVATSTLGFTGGSSLFTDAGATTYLTNLGDNLSVGTSSSLGLFTVSTTSAATALSVAQYGTGDLVNIFDGAIEVFTIEDGGNIGISTTSPASTLDVWGDFRVGTGSTPVLSANLNGGSGYVGINDLTPDFRFEVTGTSTSGYFGVTNPTGSDGGVFMIDENADVGIGTTNPLDRLHVAGGNILINNTQSIRGRNNSGTPNTLMAYDSSNDLQIGSGIGSDLMLYGNTSQQFLVGGSEYMRLNSVGALGINDTTPDFKLEIRGTSTNGYFGITSIGGSDGDTFIVAQSGNVGIGTTSLARELTVAGDIRVGANTGLGCIEDFDGTLIGGTCSSDRSLKSNITPLSKSINKDILAGLVALTPVTYNWNEIAADNWLKNTSVTNTGLIAQDVEKQFPELVVENEGIKQVKFTNLTFYLIEGLKQMWEIVTGNQDKIVELEDRIQELESALEIVHSPSPAPTDPASEEDSETKPEPAEETASSTTASSTDQSEEENEPTTDPESDSNETIEKPVDTTAPETAEETSETETPTEPEEETEPEPTPEPEVTTPEEEHEV